MKKAIYYHNRSMNSIREAEASSNKINSIESIKSFSQKNINSLYRGIDKWLLARMGLINNNIEKDDDIYKLSSVLNAEQYIEVMKKEQEL